MGTTFCNFTGFALTFLASFISGSFASDPWYDFVRKDEIFNCTGESLWYQHPLYPSRGYSCRPESNGLKVMDLEFHCADNQCYTKGDRGWGCYVCLLPDNLSKPDDYNCPVNGIFPVPNDPTRIYTCGKDDTGNIKFTSGQRCPHGHCFCVSAMYSCCLGLCPWDFNPSEKKLSPKPGPPPMHCYGESDCDESSDKWDVLCKRGQRQSPIDLPAFNDTNIGAAGCQIKLVVDAYKNGDAISRLRNTGHSLHVWFTPTWHKINSSDTILYLNNVAYIFERVHFHWGETSNVGSEHTINGQSYAMEMHFVHYRSHFESLWEAVEFGDAESVAVIAVLLEGIEENKKNLTTALDTSLQPIVTNLLYVSQVSENFVSFHGAWTTGPVDFTSLIYKAGPHVYRYHGSFTTPGCHQVVLWHVLANPVKIPDLHIEAFRQIYDTKGTKLIKNNRSIQPLNGRDLNFCKV